MTVPLYNLAVGTAIIPGRAHRAGVGGGVGAAPSTPEACGRTGALLTGTRNQQDPRPGTAGVLPPGDPGPEAGPFPTATLFPALL